MAKNKSVFGIYPNRESLSDGLQLARDAGFRNTDVSVLFPENLGNKEFAHTKSSKAPEGAAVGAGSGAMVGGVLGWLAGIGSLAIPGIGPFIAAGPIMGLLAGIGAGGAVGGVVGGLIGMGVPEYEAKRYEGRLRRGGMLVSIHCDDSDWVTKAKDILERTGAEDISTTSEEKADFAASDKPAPRRGPGTVVDVRAAGVSGEGKIVRDVMSRDVDYVDLNSTLNTAYERMRGNKNTLLVVRSGDDVVGVVTDREILRASGSGYDAAQTDVRVALSQEYPYCLEHEYAADAERTMRDRGVRQMLVLDENRRVVGIVTADDLARSTEGTNTRLGAIGR